MKSKIVTVLMDKQMDFQEEIQKSPFELFEEFHMIGCFEGEEDLSQNYKKKLSALLPKGIP